MIGPWTFHEVRTCVTCGKQKFNMFRMKMTKLKRWWLSNNNNNNNNNNKNNKNNKVMMMMMKTTTMMMMMMMMMTTTTTTTMTMMTMMTMTMTMTWWFVLTHHSGSPICIRNQPEISGGVFCNCVIIAIFTHNFNFIEVNYRLIIKVKINE